METCSVDREKIQDINESFRAKEHGLTFCYLSHIAYHKKNYIESRLFDAGAKHVVVDTETHAEFFTAEFEEFRVVSFRGTFESWTDIAYDLMFWKKEFYGIRAHYGFVCYIEKILDRIQRSLAGTDKSKPIYYTGHSLGGALAILYSLVETPVGIYTYGSPQVSGGHKFEYHFDGGKINHDRYCVDTDPIPMLPSCLFGYSHAGYEYRLATEKKSIKDYLWNFKYHSSKKYYEAFFDNRN